MAPEPAAPLATYRLQISPEQDLDAAADLVDYLAALGVSDVYTSPLLQASPGSTHGYDVVDHSTINVELGGVDAYRRLRERLAAEGLGHVLDIVPNHMAIGTPTNRWWWDVLENGPSSVYAAYFDVDWDPPDAKLRNTVLLPVLGDHYGRVLEAGELGVERRGDAFLVTYHDHEFPVAPRSLDTILERAAARAPEPAADALRALAVRAAALPPSWATDRASVEARHRDKRRLAAAIGALVRSDAGAARALDAVVAAVTADLDELDALLDRQNYRLAFWRTAGRELDYRRFFDITTLVGLRVEEAQVFGDSHAAVVDLVRSGAVRGLRIDHPDGLRDPSGYLRRLSVATGGVWTVVEKILEPGESLPETWPVAGTTGYEFLNLLGGLFVDPDGERELDDVYRTVTGDASTFAEAAYAAKVEMLAGSLAADVRRLTSVLVDVCERHRRQRDHTRQTLTRALVEIAASFPVYRTYVGPDRPASDADEHAVAVALHGARERAPDLDGELIEFLRALLTGRIDGDTEREFVARFQQLTGPVMAKGVEDTAFYRWSRFVALNEVGGAPDRFGTSVADFHEACAAVQARYPTTMLASTTHDTKRSEDVRARLVLLSEISDRWRSHAERWVAPRGDIGRPFAYFLEQAIFGAHPLSVDRAVAYAQKAAREAKLATAWTAIDEEYERILDDYVRSCLGGEHLEAVEALVDDLRPPWMATAVAQQVLRLMAPGVPDVYQGTELWDLSLVDPDSRRPVDWELRRKLLAALDAHRAGAADRARAGAAEGLPKLFATTRLLHLRREHPEWFGEAGTYEPLEASGPAAHRVVAFARSQRVLTVTARLAVSVARAGWGGTTVRLPRGSWADVLSGATYGAGEVALGTLLAAFPAAVLVRTA